MSKLKFKLNRQGVRELMQSGPMQTVLNEKADRVRKNCGEGFEQDSMVGKNRANAMVYARTRQAKARNNRENTLLKALKP